MPKELKTEILIVDSSLAKATGLSIKEHSKMQAYIKGVKALAAKASLLSTVIPISISKRNQ
jgi:hypothetical protein